MDDEEMIFKEFEDDDEFEVDRGEDDEEEDEEEGDEEEEGVERAEGEDEEGDEESRPKKKRKIEEAGEEDDENFSSSSESEDEPEEDENAGEKELVKQQREQKRKEAAQKKKKMFEIKVHKKSTEGDGESKPKRPRNRHTAAELLAGDRRVSKRTAAMKNTQDVIQRLQESEARRASGAQQPVQRKVVHVMTQEERLEEAKKTEKKNLASLNTYFEVEEEKKRRQKEKMNKRPQLTHVVRYLSTKKLVPPRRIFTRPKFDEIKVEPKREHEQEQGSTVTMLENGDEPKITVLEDGQQRAESNQESQNGIENQSSDLGNKEADGTEPADDQGGKMDIDSGKKDAEEDGDVFSTPKEHSIEPTEEIASNAPTADGDVDSKKKEKSVEVETDKEAEKKEQEVEDEVKRESPEKAEQPNLDDEEAEKEGQNVDKESSKKKESTSEEAGKMEVDNDKPEANGTMSEETAPRNDNEESKIKQEDEDEETSEVKLEEPKKARNDDLPPDSNLPDIHGPWNLRTKTTISMFDFLDENDYTKARSKKILLGDQAFYTEKPPPIDKKHRLCVVTGKPAHFIDPGSGMPYASLEAYKIIELVRKGGIYWNPTFGGVYTMPTHNTRHAQGVPEGFGRPDPSKSNDNEDDNNDKSK